MNKIFLKEQKNDYGTMNGRFLKTEQYDTKEKRGTRVTHLQGTYLNNGYQLLVTKK